MSLPSPNLSNRIITPPNVQNTIAFLNFPQTTRDSTFPTEIWSMIATTLATYARIGTKALRSLCQTSHLLNSVATPLLYKTFRWIPHRSESFPIYDLPSIPDPEYRRSLATLRRGRWAKLPRQAGPKPYLFFRTLLHREELIQHVKQIQVLCVHERRGIFRDRGEVIDGRLSTNELRECRWLIHTNRVVEGYKWNTKLDQGRLDVILGLLLLLFCRSTKLEHIGIRIRSAVRYDCPLFDAIEIINSFKQYDLCLFASVKSVTLSRDEPIIGIPKLRVVGKDRRLRAVGGNPAGSFLTLGPGPKADFYLVHHRAFFLMQISGLTSLEPNYCCPAYAPEVWQRLPLCPNLRRLSLKRGIMGHRNMITFLKSTPNLEELDFDLVYQHTETVSESLCCAVLNQALSKLAKTLTKLKIEVFIKGPNFLANDLMIARVEDMEEIWEPKSVMGSMKHFTKLRSLYIPIILLLPRVPKGKRKWKQDNLLIKMLPNHLEEFHFPVDKPFFDYGESRRAVQVETRLFIKHYLRQKFPEKCIFDEAMVGKMVHDVLTDAEADFIDERCVYDSNDDDDEVEYEDTDRDQYPQGLPISTNEPSDVSEVERWPCEESEDSSDEATHEVMDRTTDETADQAAVEGSSGSYSGSFDEFDETSDEEPDYELDEYWQPRSIRRRLA